jgi:hypothetical protein
MNTERVLPNGMDEIVNRLIESNLQQLLDIFSIMLYTIYRLIE